MDQESPPAPRVLAVLVTHEGRPWLVDCLRALRAVDYPDLNVVVVDSASSYRVEAVTRRALPEAEFVRTERNSGFGAAANLGLEASAEAPHAAYYLFLHDDVAIEPDCISHLVAAAVETGAGVVGGKGTAWEDREALIEVGMYADQFCYPFSGLEEGEIDQGQHDTRREVLYVTSACALISRPVVERIGSWDAGYFLFGEDLDLCIRSRLAGFPVVVEPRARFRHAAALANRIRETRASSAVRFYTRRNRMRTIVKDQSAWRVGLMFPLYSTLMIAEMALLAALRRFEELPAYPRAALSFAVSLPDVLRRRRAVQSRKIIPDRRVRRLMVKDSHRARVFLERRLSDWERGTLRIGTEVAERLSPQRIRSTLVRWLSRPKSLAYTAVALLLAYAFRKTLFSAPVASGSLWQLPQDLGRLLEEYTAGWRNTSLGTEAAPSPALAAIWALSHLALRNSAASQTLLIVMPVVLGLVGIARFARLRFDGPAPAIAALVLYGLGPLLGLMIGTGDLGAVVMFAAAPWMLESGLRMSGSVPGGEADRPAVPDDRDSMLRGALRLGLVTALVLAFAPSALPALLLMWLIVTARAWSGAWDRREALTRGAWLGASIAVAALLLVPWTFESLRPGGSMLAPIFAGRGGGPLYSPLWEGLGFTGALVLDPQGGAFSHLIPAAVIVGAVAFASERHREVTSLVILWAGFGILAGLVSHGAIPAPSVSPSLWLSIPFVVIAALGAHLVGALARELPRRSLGLRHLLALALAAAVAVGGAGSRVGDIGGRFRARSTLALGGTQESRSVLSFFTSIALQEGDFRVLWLGEAWVDPIRQGLLPAGTVPYLLTRPEGLGILDAWPAPPTEGVRRLEGTVDAIAGLRLHLAGHLLAPAGVRYVVVDPEDSPMVTAISRQRDIALQQQQSGVAIFENLQWTPRAALAPPSLAEASSAGGDAAGLMLARWRGGRSVPESAPGMFEMDVPRTYHPAFLLADNFNEGWEASVGSVRVEGSEAFGWAQRFTVQPGMTGRLEVVFADRWQRALWVAVQLLLVVLAVSMVRTRTVEIRGWLG